jgi:hypothetical protein
MSVWQVKVTGLGGPATDFHVRDFQVTADTPGAAIDRAVKTYLEKFGPQGYVLAKALVLPSQDGVTFLVDD